MAEYSVGIATRNKIYAVSKRLFYERGVRATSYAQISEAADVNRGLIPYYFKSKANIAIAACIDFTDSIDRAMVEWWGADGFTLPERNIIFETIQFELLNRDPHVLRFYDEVMNDPECHDAMLKIQETVMNEIAAGSHVSVTPEQLRSITCMVNGTEAELVSALRSGYLQEPMEDFVRRDILCCYFLLGSDTEQANRWCDEGFAKARAVVPSCSEDFVVTLAPREGAEG